MITQVLNNKYTTLRASKVENFEIIYMYLVFCSRFIRAVILKTACLVAINIEYEDL